MNREELAARYEDRLRRYCGLAAAPSVKIELTCDSGVVDTYAAQIGLVTAASLLGRLFWQVQILIPANIAIHPSVRSPARTLESALTREVKRARPAELRTPASNSEPLRTLRVNYGTTPSDINFVGCGWAASVGPGGKVSSSPSNENPLGPALAGILAAAESFLLALDAAHVLREESVNLWDWSTNTLSGPAWRTGLDLGDVWVVGVGSVGSSALYFMCIAQLIFSASLFDGDKLKLENISRSPIFSSEDKEGEDKVDIVARYLCEGGTKVNHFRATWLHLAGTWETRSPGQPDIVISTANEYHVRWHIESMYPPVQLHASTGKNWQATAFRHVPIIDSCSLCVFPDTGVAAQPVCATGEIVDPITNASVDASLPFLSYAAGLMIAVEACKLSMGERQSSRRTYLQFRGTPLVFTVPLSPIDTCSCRNRREDIHRSAIEGSRYASLSGI